VRIAGSGSFKLKRPHKQKHTRALASLCNHKFGTDAIIYDYLVESACSLQCGVQLSVQPVLTPHGIASRMSAAAHLYAACGKLLPSRCVE
jgi:hypothetical protein